MGQGNARTPPPGGNSGRDVRADRLDRRGTAPGSVAPDPHDRRRDELRDPAGRRAAGTLDRCRAMAPQVRIMAVDSFTGKLAVGTAGGPRTGPERALPLSAQSTAAGLRGM